MIEQNENEPQETEIHLWDYIHMLWHKKLLISIVSFIVIFVGLFVYKMTPDKYNAYTQVRLKQDYELQEVNVYNERYFSNQYWMSTELEVLKSESVIRDLVETTKINGVDLVTYFLNKHEPTLSSNTFDFFGTSPSAVKKFLFGWIPRSEKRRGVALTPKQIKEVQQMYAIRKIQGMISLNVGKESSIVNITVTSIMNGEEAKVIANALPIIYEQFTVKDKIQAINKGLDIIRDQVKEKSASVLTLRNKLTGIREKYHITRSHEEPIKGLDPEIVNRTKTALMNAKIEMQLEEKTWKKIEVMQDSELAEAFGVLMEDNSGYFQLKNDLNSASLQFKLLKIDFGEAHPKVRRAKVELEELTKQMQVRIKGIKSAMKLRYEKAVTKYNGIKVEYDELANELSGERSLHIQEFNAVANDLVFEKANLHSIRQSLSEKEVNLRSPRSVIEIISTAVTPRTKVSPIFIKVFGITVFLALALSVGLVFLLDYLDNSLKSIDQIEQITRMEVIASIPRLKKNEILSSHQFIAVFNAANLAFNKGSKVLSVHSSMPGEGKSTISVKTAMESARTGNNVLIIDMDVRRPTVNKVLGMTMAPGIAEVVVANSAADLKSMIRETKHEHLSIITAGFFKDGPPLTSRLMNDIIDQVKDDYDFIVLDCSPITVVNESLVIADASDEILLVVRPNYSNIKMVKRAIGMLKGLNCHSVGVVANQVLRKSSIYYANKLYNKYYS